MRRGFTLVEVAVAIAVLATAGVAVERLLARSVATVDDDARRARTLAVAQAVLAETALHPLPGDDAAARDGLVVERRVGSTGHAALREIRVRVADPGSGAATELVELVYVPQR